MASQKNNMEFSRRLGKQKSLCVGHTLAGPGMYHGLWCRSARGPVPRHQRRPSLPPAAHRGEHQAGTMGDLRRPSTSPPKSPLWARHPGWASGIVLMNGNRGATYFCYDDSMQLHFTSLTGTHAFKGHGCDTWNPPRHGKAWRPRRARERKEPPTSVW